MLEQVISNQNCLEMQKFNCLSIFRLWKRCGEGCSSGNSLPIDPDTSYFPGGCLPTGSSTGNAASGGESGGAVGGAGPSASATATAGHSHSQETLNNNSGQTSRGGSLPGGNQRLSQSSQVSQQLTLAKPQALASLAGLLGSQSTGGASATASDSSPNLSQKLSLAALPSQPKKLEVEPLSRAEVKTKRNIISHTVIVIKIILSQIIDPLQVYEHINLGRRIDPIWPEETWRARGGRNAWKDWLPEAKMQGNVSDFER